jgi:NhaA family Na+:H+ antiporter
MALAIIDDLGAIIVVALFYGNHFNGVFFAISGVIYALLLACNYFKIKFGVVQIILSLLLWFAVYNSGIEASITGVLVAFATPTKFLPSIEKAIHRYVNFLILPLFALANTAIFLPTDIGAAVNTSVGLGIIFGLVIGKPLGILIFSRIMVALNLATLPRGVKWKQIVGMGMLAGIGFTMSIFTTMLAFKDPVYQDIAKIAIIISVVISLLMSLFYFMALSVKEKVMELEVSHHSSENNNLHGELAGA